MALHTTEEANAAVITRAEAAWKGAQHDVNTHEFYCIRAVHADYVPVEWCDFDLAWDATPADIKAAVIAKLEATEAVAPVYKTAFTKVDGVDGEIVSEIV